jgi:hypothetical protein
MTVRKKNSKTKKKKYANTKPQAGRQLEAFTTKVDFMIYGGARGK